MGNQSTLPTLEDLPFLVQCCPAWALCKAHEIILGVEIPEVLIIHPFIIVDIGNPIY